MVNNISNSVLETINISQDERWQFCVKLMYLLRCGKIDMSDTNLDIYKRVIGAIAQDNLNEYEAKQKEYDNLKKIMES